MENELKCKIGEQIYVVKIPFAGTMTYRVENNNTVLGYIRQGYVNEETGAPIWVGNTQETMALAPELGIFIENLS